MDATNPPTLHAPVLGQFLLMQSVLCNLPNEASIFSFVCQGLLDLPGVAEAKVAEAAGGPPDPSRICYPLQLGGSRHGELCLRLSDPSVFAPYEPYLRNFCFMLAVILEERHQRRLNEQHTVRLEQRVAERTADLEGARKAEAGSRLEALRMMEEAVLAQRRAEETAAALQHEALERKRAQQDQARLVAILEATPDFVGFADAKDTHILYINPAGRSMVGIGAEEDVTRLMIADVHPEWTNRLFREEILPTAARDGVWTGEFDFLSRDGREIPVISVVLAHRSPGGELERFSTISRDITERKLAEEALRESERRLRSVLTAAPLVLWNLDRAGTILLSSESLFAGPNWPAVWPRHCRHRGDFRSRERAQAGWPGTVRFSPGRIPARCGLGRSVSDTLTRPGPPSRTVQEAAMLDRTSNRGSFIGSSLIRGSAKAERSAWRRLAPLALCLALAVLAEAGGAEAGGAVRLPRFFSDHMLLQRDLPIRIWGWAEPGEAVKVTLSGAEASTQADAQGRWKVELPARKDGEGLELSVAGKNTITLKDLIVGDVWLCSGQSNMEMTLGGCLGAPADIQSADHPKIRRIKFGHVTSPVAEEDALQCGPWQVCTPGTAGGFTAVGFYFAREIQQRSGVPIGILDVNWGGTRIEPWTAPEGMEQVPELKAAFAERQKGIEAYQAALPRHLAEVERWVAQSREALQKGGRISAAPKMPDHPAAGGWASQHNAMIHPLTRLPIKGALWYQGESNGGEGESYFHKMRALIGGWRQLWGQGEFPFYFVQLANFQKPTDLPAGGDGWAGVRAAQLKSLSIPRTGMAVIIDIGEAGDIHPRNKYDVGMRLARWALAGEYGQKDLVVSGPLFRELKVEGEKARVFFNHVGSGLMVGKKEGRADVTEVKDGKLARFAIAGADKVWYWAEGTIDGETVVLTSPKVPAPVAVRYAYAMNPAGANLYNREGLPASPFRTDD